ncbi:GNAT family N-acetyltransferase [Collimonas humicola]|uniref:GNAT family N-acetyltransferase n=1 Tax=Collimonas humicola TaxID=2825886 RepID=UPI001B8B4F8A|nr:GNAT family N-acetyltransferase [Collimonas humicola]
MIRVELVSETQHESLIDLLCELHVYYNEGSAVSREIVRVHLLENLLAADSPQRLAVAFTDSGDVVGLAAITLFYSLVEPTFGKCRQCHLKELYVRSSARSMGAGKMLMSWVTRHALENGCSRIDWSVKASNVSGISFYEELGADLVVERLSYRLSEPNMSRLAYQCAKVSLEDERLV